MAEQTNSGPCTQSTPEEREALFGEARSLMDDARPRSTVAQDGAAAVGRGPIFNCDLAESELALVDLDHELAASVAKALRRGMSEPNVEYELSIALRNGREEMQLTAEVTRKAAEKEAQRQYWQERSHQEWASEAPDRAAMALAVTVAGCEAALGHADAFGVLRLFDAAALDTFVTLRELAEGREGGEMRGAAPDPEAQHEKERLFGVAHALLEARRDELAAAVEKVSTRKMFSEDLRPEDWGFYVSLHQDGRRMDREELHELRFGESPQPVATSSGALRNRCRTSAN
jgi:hypothetical protein